MWSKLAYYNTVYRLEGRDSNMALVVDLVVMLGVWLLSMAVVIEGSCAIRPDGNGHVAIPNSWTPTRSSACSRTPRDASSTAGWRGSRGISRPPDGG